jgi:hypothetical protein
MRCKIRETTGIVADGTNPEKAGLLQDWNCCMMRLNQSVRLYEYSYNSILNGLARISVDKDIDIIVVRCSPSSWLCTLGMEATVYGHI